MRAQVGNQATMRIARSLQSRLLQRVGEKKLGYLKSPHGTAEVEDLLAEAFAQVAATRATAKDKTEAELAAAIKDAKDRKLGAQSIVLDWYPQQLGAAVGDPLAALKASTPFAQGLLKLGSYGPETEFIDVTDREGKVVAFISVGDATFLPELVPVDRPPDPKARIKFTKLHGGKHSQGEQREYVEDDRGVPTRRYAYCEKSIYQFMELVLTGRLTGRYQLLHEALGTPTTVDEARSDIIGMVAGREDPNQRKLEPEQLAFLHQWMGSGQQQRGLSLTSTPRKGAIYSNDADPFKEDDGVLIKVDLAKVPRDVVLLNHYAAGGVKDRLGTVSEERYQRGPEEASSGKYAYKGSVQKNRELFLERLLPEWVSEVTFHADGKVITVNGNRSVLQEEYVKQLAAAYSAGFAGAAAPSGADAGMVTKGCRSRELYQRGYRAGVSDWSDYLSAFGSAQLEVWEAFTTVQAQTASGRRRQAEEKAAENKRKRREGQLKGALKGAVGEKAEEIFKQKQAEWADEDKREAETPQPAFTEAEWAPNRRLDEAKKLIKERKEGLRDAKRPQRLAASSVYDAFIAMQGTANLEALVTRPPHLDRWALLEVLAKPEKTEKPAAGSSSPARKREPPIYWLGWAQGASGALSPAQMGPDLYRHRPLKSPQDRESVLSDLAGYASE